MTEDRIAASYDAVAARYAEEIGDEMAHKFVDRAWLRCLAELAGDGIVADVGCGPGHVTAFLAQLGVATAGIDLSPQMVAVARKRNPDLTFAVGSLLALPAADGAWSGAVCAYAIIHLEEHQRPVAFRELARAIRREGWLLLSFHISGEGRQPGEVQHVERWWEQDVDLEFHFLSPRTIADEVRSAGFEVMAVTERSPWPQVEAQTRRCHLLAKR
jgi:SAM-dependent methyltransferase